MTGSPCFDTYPYGCLLLFLSACLWCQDLATGRLFPQHPQVPWSEDPLLRVKRHGHLVVRILINHHNDSCSGTITIGHKSSFDHGSDASFSSFRVARAR